MTIFGKRSPLRERIKRVAQDIADLDRQIRTMSQPGASGSRPGLARRGPAESVRGVGAAAENGRPKALAPAGSLEGPLRERDDRRFVNYLASSFQAMHPAKDEHRLQRNKTIVMAVFVVLIIIVLMALLLR